jgi:indolepyruvate ferredoxin oxidoreductase alpha subunit
MQKLLLGNEAIAQGAIDAGLSGIYAYPGTPSTEITEYVQRSPEARERNIHRKWSVNEKTAMEAALGMSYAGKRSMVTMKHVGLNVAADPFMNAAVSGVNGGLIIVVADDPSMHSSQNEQDSRFFAKFAMIPVLEPSTQQEAYDMVRYGFELSEKFKLPVMLRTTTRLSHSRAGVHLQEALEENPLNPPPSSSTQFILLPSNARGRYRHLLSLQDGLLENSEKSQYNEFIEGTDKSLGIISSGIAANYLEENFRKFDLNYSYLKIREYPLPKEKIRQLYDTCDKILVLEEGYPIIEETITNFLNDDKVIGRLTGHVPRDGELNPTIVATSLGIASEIVGSMPDLVENRPPKLCVGCGHADLFNELNEITKEITDRRVFSDIGCYTLGALPPYNAIDTCIDMGASITMAKGAADAGVHPALAVIGDSTFTHSGITGLLDAVHEKSAITVLISDNSTTAMTGGQESTAKGRIADICRGIGVEEEHLRVIVPLRKNMEENMAVIQEEIAYMGVSVVIAQRECLRI